MQKTNTRDRDGIPSQMQADCVTVGNPVEFNTGGCLCVNQQKPLLKINVFA
jgi:hypothetical protein